MRTAAGYLASGANIPQDWSLFDDIGGKRRPQRDGHHMSNVTARANAGMATAAHGITTTPGTQPDESSPTTDHSCSDRNGTCLLPLRQHGVYRRRRPKRDQWSRKSLKVRPARLITASATLAYKPRPTVQRREYATVAEALRRER